MKGQLWNAGTHVSSKQTCSMDSTTRQQTFGMVSELFSRSHRMGGLGTPINGSWREVLSSGRCWVSVEGQAEQRAIGDGPSFVEC